MTIASKTNLLRIGFMGLGLGKGLTTDYTNNADGEAALRTNVPIKFSGPLNTRNDTKTQLQILFVLVSSVSWANLRHILHLSVLSA